MQNSEYLPLLHQKRRRPDCRSTLCSLSAKVWIAVGALALLDTNNAIKPVPQPQRISQSGSGLSYVSLTAAKPSPDADIDELMISLPTVEDVQEFLMKHTEHENVYNPATFLTTFRESPERFQQHGWTGPCNTFAEFASYWAYVHGGSPYIITLWPKGIFTKCRENWHQIAACRTSDKEMLIFDNQSVTPWKGTIEEYVEETHPEKSVASLGGVILWRLTQDNFRAKLADHAVFNTEELKICPLPHRLAPSPQLIAKD